MTRAAIAVHHDRASWRYSGSPAGGDWSASITGCGVLRSMVGTLRRARPTDWIWLRSTVAAAALNDQLVLDRYPTCWSTGLSAPAMASTSWTIRMTGRIVVARSTVEHTA